MVGAFERREVLHRFVFHFQTLKIHDAQKLISGFPNLTLLQLEHEKGYSYRNEFTKEERSGSRSGKLFTTGTQNARGQEKNGLQERENGFERDSNQSKRERNKPDKWKQNQRQQRQGPAEHKENAPAHKKQ
jgi:hypothetical protein